ncbi:MAG: class I SAM-dependent methyltransferase [Anaerolineales bacterium]|nr:class I SAM-dependent methyltransferase [Anaerolineales bacterium]
MDPITVQQLIDLNHQFYQTFAVQFAATRQRLQPGVQRVLKGLADHARILDLGCGNGEVWRYLSKMSRSCQYVGLDSSAELLAIARQAAADHNHNPSKSLSGASSSSIAHFFERDLSDPDWDADLPEASFEVILAFAVLHHLPGKQLHKQLLVKVHRLLSPGGCFYFSVWQFLNSPRLKARIQEWERAGLSSSQVEPGDYLLDWRQGGSGIRYVHHFSQDELAKLADECGYRVSDAFFSDGEGGKLGLYQWWERV